MHLDIEKGELFLYDYTGRTPFFQYSTFTLDEHKLDGDVIGTLQCQLDRENPPLKVQFSKNCENFTLFSTFHEHSLEKISSLATFFCDSALPAFTNGLQVEKGNISGHLQLSFESSRIAELNGVITVNDVELRNEKKQLSFIDRLETNFSYDERGGVDGEFNLIGRNCFLGCFEDLAGSFIFSHGLLKQGGLRGKALGLECELLCEEGSCLNGILKIGEQSQISFEYDFKPMSGSFHAEGIALKNSSLLFYLRKSLFS